MDPRLYEADNIPRVGPVGSLKWSCQYESDWRPFIIEASKPPVASIARQHGIRKMYKVRRFVFRYHGVLSAAMTVSITESGAPV